MLGGHKLSEQSPLQQYSVDKHKSKGSWCFHPSCVTGQNIRAAAAFYVQLWSLDVCQFLVPDDRLRNEGGRQQSEIFSPSISTVLVPRADFAAILLLSVSVFFSSYSMCVSPVQSCGFRVRREDGFGLSWPGHLGAIIHLTSAETSHSTAFYFLFYIYIYKRLKHQLSLYLQRPFL